MSASLYGCRGVAHSSRAGAFSAISPRYMTATVSATWRTIARSCEMRRRPRSNSRASSTEVRDLRLRRGVERRQRLVEDDDGRVRRERTGDGDALALAARELVWIAARGSFGKPDLHEESAIWAARCDREARPSTASASPICSPTRRRGLSEENGFWKTICRRTSSRTGASGQRLDLPALEANRPRPWCHHPDGRAGEGRLAAARLADESDDRAAFDLEARAGDRAYRLQSDGARTPRRRW